MILIVTALQIVRSSFIRFYALLYAFILHTTKDCAFMRFHTLSEMNRFLKLYINEKGQIFLIIQHLKKSTFKN